MFDVGFSELVVIGIVALVVIGPERLPKVARTVGLLLGRLQRYVGDVKADINREIQLDELKKLQQQMTDQVSGLEASVRHEMREVESSVSEVAASLPVDAAAAPALLDERPTGIAPDAASAGVALNAPVSAAAAAETTKS